jgi:hypothetical protein
MPNPSLYSERQQRILGLLPVFTAPFSVLGSSLIIYDILAGRRTTLKSVYRRLMLGMSILDLIVSLSMTVFGPWAVPEEASYYAIGARWTFRTCEVSGFLLNFLFGTMWYSAFLAVYFLLRIKFEWKEKTIARYVEPVAHIACTLMPLIGGAIAVANDYINPVEILPGFCWIYEYPPGCLSDHEVDCIRGEDAYEFTSSAGVAGPLFIVIFIAMVLITLKVRQTELRIRRYAGGHNRELELTKQTGIQALFYIGAFFLTFFPLVMLDLLWNVRYKGYYFYFAVLAKFLTPLQGFFNAWIYMHKRFRDVSDSGGSAGLLRRLSSMITVGRTPLNVAGDMQESRTRAEDAYECNSSSLVQQMEGDHDKEESDNQSNRIVLEHLQEQNGGEPDD